MILQLAKLQEKELFFRALYLRPILKGARSLPPPLVLFSILLESAVTHLVCVSCCSTHFPWYFLRPEYFIDFDEKMDPIPGCDIRLVFTLQTQRQYTAVRKCVHLWNNYHYIIILWAHFTTWTMCNVIYYGPQ